MVIYPQETLRDDRDMDIQTLHSYRRAHLRKLVSERFGGSQAAFARQAECYPTEVSRWLKSPGTVSWTRNMNEASARKIETMLSLPQGYLDQPLDTAEAAHPALQEPVAPYWVLDPAAPHTAPQGSAGSAAPPPASIAASQGKDSELSEAKCRHQQLVTQVSRQLMTLPFEQVKTIAMMVEGLRDLEQ